MLEDLPEYPEILHLLSVVYHQLGERMRTEPLSTLAVPDRAHDRDLFADIDGVFPVRGAGQDPAQSIDLPNTEIVVLHGRDRWKDSASILDM